MFLDRNKLALSGLPGLLGLAMLLALPACTPPIDPGTRLQIAHENERRGELITAILELKNILQSRPDYVPALLMAGRLSVEVGQSDEAIEYLTRARRLGSDDQALIEHLGQALLAQSEFERLLEKLPVASVPPAQRGGLLLLRGAALIGLGRLDEAASAYREAGSYPATAIAGLDGMARIAMITGDLAEAERLIELALERDPFSVSTFRALGALRHHQQRYAEAEAAFASAVEATAVRSATTELLLARVGLAESQWRKGDTSKALGNVKDLLDAYPWHPLPRYLRALMAYEAGEFRLATEYLKEVRLSVPQHRASQQLLAACEYELGNYSDAELLLRDYLERAPEDVAMRSLLARTRLQMGNPTGAMAALLPVVELAPDDGEFLALLGKASLHGGDARTSAAYLRRAAQQLPDNDDVLISLIVAELGAGQIDRAEQRLAQLPDTPEMERARTLLDLVLLLRKAENERALLYAKQLRQAAPANLHAMLALAELAEGRGDPVRAIEWLEMARSRNPEAIEPRLLLVRYYSERDDHERAHDIAVEAVQIRPYQADALVALGLEKLALGQTGQAVATFDEALRASPESGLAYLGLARAAAARDDVDAARNYIGRAVELDVGLMPRAVAFVLELARSDKRVQALSLASHLQTVGENLPHGYAAAGDLHMAEKRFGEALVAYESALQRSDDRVVLLKTFIAAREAGSAEPTRLLRQWLAAHPSDERVRRMLENSGERL